MKYDREIRAEIKLINAPNFDAYLETIPINNLRIAFSIKKSVSWSTNSLSLNIWNLSESKRNELVNIGDQVSLFAGYKNEGGAQLLFVGDSTQIQHSFQQPEIITSIICGDGDKILNNLSITASYSADTKATDILRSIAGHMNMNIVGGIPENNIVYPLGFYQSNLAKNMLQIVCEKAKLHWSVQNGNLIFNRVNEPNEKPPFLINSQNGLVGVPERFSNKQGEIYPNGKNIAWKVKTLLRPDILPNDSVKIFSKTGKLDGIYTVQSIQHDGDNYGDQFLSTLEVY